MADISADGLLPSGEFTPTFFSGVLQVAAGVTGTVITIPAPAAGKRVRLTGLIGNDSTFTVNANGVAVVSGLALGTLNTSAVGSFAVGSGSGGGASQGAGSIQYIESRTAITVVKSAGNTANIIYYSYAEGY